MLIISETIASAMNVLQISGHSLFDTKDVDGSKVNKLSQVDESHMRTLSNRIYELDLRLTTCSPASDMTSGLLKTEVTSNGHVLVYVSDIFAEQLGNGNIHYIDSLARYLVDELDAVNYPDINKYIEYLVKVRNIINKL